jgi:hypothetical protein
MFDINHYRRLTSRGFSFGLGDPSSCMCVNAALCHAQGRPGLDDLPRTVHLEARDLTIVLNDNNNWSSPQARAEALAPLGLATLGTEDMDTLRFRRRLNQLFIQQILTRFMRDLPPQRNTSLYTYCQRCPQSKLLEARHHFIDEYHRIPMLASHIVLPNGAELASAASRLGSPNPEAYLRHMVRIAIRTLREQRSPGIKLMEEYQSCH